MKAIPQPPETNVNISALDDSSDDVSTVTPNDATATPSDNDNGNDNDNDRDNDNSNGSDHGAQNKSEINSSSRSTLISPSQQRAQSATAVVGRPVHHLRANTSVTIASNSSTVNGNTSNAHNLYDGRNGLRNSGTQPKAFKAKVTSSNTHPSIRSVTPPPNVYLNNRANGHANGVTARNFTHNESVDYYELPSPVDSEDFRFESIGTSEEHASSRNGENTPGNNTPEDNTAKRRFDFSILRAFRKFTLSVLTGAKDDDSVITKNETSNLDIHTLPPYPQPLHDVETEPASERTHEYSIHDHDGNDDGEEQEVAGIEFEHSIPIQSHKIQHHTASRKQQNQKQKERQRQQQRYQKRQESLKVEQETDNRVTPSAQVLKSDNLKPFLIPASKETALINKIRDIALSDDNDYVGIADAFWLRAVLRARNGDVMRSIALITNYLQWRRSVEYHTKVSNGVSDKVREILETGTFSVIGNKAKSEQPILTIRYEYLDPSKHNWKDSSVAFCILIEYLMREYPICQTHGMIVMEEMSGSKVSNLDIFLAKFLTKAMSSIIPLRITAMFFCNAKKGVRSVLRFMSPLLSRKFKTSVYVMHEGLSERFATFFDADQTPTFMRMHGTLTWTHDDQLALTEEVLKVSRTWPKASTFRDSQ